MQHAIPTAETVRSIYRAADRRDVETLRALADTFTSCAVAHSEQRHDAAGLTWAGLSALAESLASEVAPSVEA